MHLDKWWKGKPCAGSHLADVHVALTARVFALVAFDAANNGFSRATAGIAERAAEIIDCVCVS